MTKDEALKLARYALTGDGWKKTGDAIRAIDEALAEQPAQPQQEPVAWVSQYAHQHKEIDFYEPDIKDLPVGTKLYTSPPQRPWVGLTDEDITEVWRELKSKNEAWSDLDFGRAIEAKLKEKNT